MDPGSAFRLVVKSGKYAARQDYCVHVWASRSMNYGLMEALGTLLTSLLRIWQGK
jgi:hypothetical protein